MHTPLERIINSRRFSLPRSGMFRRYCETLASLERGQVYSKQECIRLRCDMGKMLTKKVNRSATK